MDATPAWEDKQKEEAELREGLEAAETKLGTLAAKQGRVSQFKSQKERDAHLKETIKTRKETVATRVKRGEGMKGDLEAAREELEGVEERGSGMRSEMDGRKEVLGNLNEELVRTKEEEGEKIEKRKYVPSGLFFLCGVADLRVSQGVLETRRAARVAGQARGAGAQEPGTRHLQHDGPGALPSSSVALG